AQRQGAGERAGGGAAGARDLLDREDVGERVESSAAVLLGIGQAHEAELAHLAHGVGGELLVLVQRASTWRHHLVAELTRELADLVVFLFEQQIHTRAMSSSMRTHSGPARHTSPMPAGV